MSLLLNQLKLTEIIWNVMNQSDIKIFYHLTEDQPLILRVTLTLSPKWKKKQKKTLLCGFQTLKVYWWIINADSSVSKPSTNQGILSWQLTVCSTLTDYNKLVEYADEWRRTQHWFRCKHLLMRKPTFPTRPSPERSHPRSAPLCRTTQMKSLLPLVQDSATRTNNRASWRSCPPRTIPASTSRQPMMKPTPHHIGCRHRPLNQDAAICWPVTMKEEEEEAPPPISW